MVRLKFCFPRLILIVTLICPLLFSVSRISLAQTAQGTLAGRVTDSTGAILAGAKVTAVNEATNVSRTYKK